MLRNTKVSHKSSEIFSVILPIFKSTLNLAHIKCLSMLLGALCTMQTVCLSKLAAAFDNRVSSESSFLRFLRFLHRWYWTWMPWPDTWSLVSRSTDYTLSRWTAQTGSRRCEHQCVSTEHSVWSYVVPNPVQTPVQTRGLQLQGANQHHRAVHPIVRTWQHQMSGCRPRVRR